MKESHKAFLMTIGIIAIIVFLSVVVGLMISDSVGNMEILERNITVIGKICGERMANSDISSIQDSGLIVYGTTLEDCKNYEIGSNYTIRYKTIRSSLSGIQYNLMEGV